MRSGNRLSSDSKLPAPPFGVIVVCGFSSDAEKPPLVQRTWGWRTNTVPSVLPMKSTASGSVATSMKFDQVWPTSQLPYLT